MNKLQQILEQVRNLDWQEPGRWPLGVRLGAATLLFMLAAAGGYYYFVWRSLHPQLVEARSEEAKLFETLEQKARKAANLQAYKDQLADMEKSFGAMLRQLPNKTEVPNLLVDISQTPSNFSAMSGLLVRVVPARQAATACPMRSRSASVSAGRICSASPTIA